MAQTPRSPNASADDPTRRVRRHAQGTHHGGLPDRIAGWASDLSTLHDLADRLGRTTDLTDAVRETLRAGAALLGARRALFSLHPADGLGPERLIGLGLSHAELGQLDTVPHAAYAAYGQAEALHPDIAGDEALHPRHREVAARLGCAASYAVPLAAATAGRLGSAVWLYDRPTAPDPRLRGLLARYLRQAAQHLANRLDLARAHAAARAVREGLIPGRIAPLPGAALAVRHHRAPAAGDSCDFFDALALPEGALGLAIGSTTGPGPAALAAAGSLRAGLRAYAVMEGEDPVAVLSDLELLLRLTEPDRAATALFCYAEPPLPPLPPLTPDRATRHLVLASAGHPPPLVIGPARVAFAETALSAPLGMLACWEAPSTHLEISQGETVLLYTTALLRATGEPLDAAFTRLESAARAATPAARADPGALADHIARAVPAAGRPLPQDVVLLAARFD